MTSGTTRAATGLAVVCWLIAAGLLVVAVVSEWRVATLGRSDLAGDAAEAAVYGTAMMSSATAGLVIAVRRRRHPVGWLFLALGIALGVGAAGDAWALQHAVVRGDRSAGPALALVAGQASFIVWFALLAAILLLTPTGSPTSPLWGVVLCVACVAAVAALIAKAVQDTPFDSPFQGVTNPWAADGAAGVVDAVASVGIALVMLALAASGVSLVVRYRRAVGDDRRQLRWLFAAAIPLPLFVAMSYAAAISDHREWRTVATGGFIAVIPLVTGLSVLRFRLYDVDRILSRTTAYVCTSLALAVVFVGVSAAVGWIVSLLTDDTTLPAVVASGVTVMIAAPLHRRLQDIVDRRFDRRRYEAHRIVREHMDSPCTGASLESVFAEALHDPTVTLAFWIDSDQTWSTADGRPVDVRPGDIVANRDGAAIARVRVDTATDHRLAASLVELALTELDNVRLRAGIAAQLAEVSASRTRIVAAQAAERRRIERNLHDGAQQRLLGLAMELRASQLRDRPHAELIGRAVDELAEAVRELRDLASGLRPPALADGLPLALDDLAGRASIPVTVDLDPVQLDAVTEDTLWFVASEALANVAKHADATAASVTLRSSEDSVSLACRDDGCGGADPRGAGLAGLADRVAAIGGRLEVTSAPGGGTTIEAVVPCAS